MLNFSKIHSFFGVFLLIATIVSSSLQLTYPISVVAANPAACTAGGTTNLDHSGDPTCAGKVQYRVIYKSIDCINSTVDFEVQIKSDPAYPQPIMGDYNIRMDYNTTVMTRIGTVASQGSLVQRNRYANGLPASDTNYGAQNLNGSGELATPGAGAGILSINGFYGGGGLGDIIPTTFTTVSTIRMNIINPAAPLNINMHNATGDFPITGNNIALDDGAGGYDLIEPAYETANIDLVGSTKNLLCAAPTITAVDDNYTTTGVTPVTLTPLTGDTAGTTIKSINGVLLTPGVLQNISIPGKGVVKITATGVITFKPNLGNVGDTIIPYVIQDLAGNTATANETINIPNLPPAAVDDRYYFDTSTQGTTPLGIQPLSGDYDPNDPGTFTAVSVLSINGVTLIPNTAQTIPVTNGTVTTTTIGQIKFLPNAGFSGNVTFPYVIKDAQGLTATANETIVVSPCGFESLGFSEHLTYEGGSDPDQDQYTNYFPIKFITTPSATVPPESAFASSVTVPANSITDYTLGSGPLITATWGYMTTTVSGKTVKIFQNLVTFESFVSIDGGPLMKSDVLVISPNAQITTYYSIEVPKACVVVLPTASDDNYTTTGTTPVTLTPLTGDTAGTTIKSINGITLTLGTAQTIPVPNGSVTIDSAGVIKFTPNPGYVGAVNFPYTIQDSTGQTATANQNIFVIPTVNPVCTNGIPNGGFTTNLNSWTATSGWIWNNDTAALATDALTNQTLSQSITGYVPSSGQAIFKIELQPAEANNLTTFGATMDISFGGTKYLTIVNPIGTGNVTYTTANGGAFTVDTTVRNQLATIYLSVPATGSTAKSLEFKHVSGDDDWYIYNVSTQICPQLELDKKSTFNDANSDNVGQVGETITYQFTVKNTGNVPLTNVTISDPNATIVGGPILSLAVGATDTTTFTGTHILTTADIALKYVDNQATVSGKDPGNNTITDLSNDPKTVGVPNDITHTLIPPYALPDVAATRINTPITYNPLINDIIPVGSAISQINGVNVVVGVPIQVTNGTVTLNSDGTLTVMPKSGFTGDINFLYTVSTPAGPRISTNTISVYGAEPDTKRTAFNTPVTYDPLANDNVPTGSRISKINGAVAVVGTPIVVENGTVTLNADGTITVIPNRGYTGAISFGYEATTPSGVIVTASDIVTIEAESVSSASPATTLIRTGGFSQQNNAIVLAILAIVAGVSIGYGAVKRGKRNR
jgi:large repetitive protein